MPRQTKTKALRDNDKADGLCPRSAVKLDTLAGVRGEMARLYRLALRRKLQSDEMTRFIYALKEIRACIESALLEDVQERLSALGLKVEARRGH